MKGGTKVRSPQPLCSAAALLTSTDKLVNRTVLISLPSTSGPIGWYGAIANLIPAMLDSQLLARQQQAVERFLATNDPAPLLIERVGGRNGLKYKPGHLPANTIVRCLRRAAPTHFTDHKGCNRNGTKITPNPLPIRMSGCGVSGVGCSEEGKYLCSYSIFGFLNLPLHPLSHPQHPAYTSFQLYKSAIRVQPQ
ncbi:hypothetical protein [Nostoc sp. FACHB-145]|uniref:hypothetical protein n=1 Tax=Nostoc sp. FACHB-145 TaxID=2692836 RepID=UPI001F54DC12|nr:hypothetical protein [Nostoc sp. FACHB-145]